MKGGLDRKHFNFLSFQLFYCVWSQSDKENLAWNSRYFSVSSFLRILLTSCQCLVCNNCVSKVVTGNKCNLCQASDVSVKRIGSTLSSEEKNLFRSIGLLPSFDMMVRKKIFQSKHVTRAVQLNNHLSKAFNNEMQKKIEKIKTGRNGIFWFLFIFTIKNCIFWFFEKYVFFGKFRVNLFHYSSFSKLERILTVPGRTDIRSLKQQLEDKTQYAAQLKVEVRQLKALTAESRRGDTDPSFFTFYRRDS